MKERLLVGSRPHMRATENWVLGTPEKAAERVRELSAAGVNRLMFSVERDEHREMLPILGHGVGPLVR
jgi:alkanesulfonate monooxygenase SsuD/methylene tetrahydromethanopterin reductase-like flavin-dependent oxidoreductase (luciferase family)